MTPEQQIERKLRHARLHQEAEEIVRRAAGNFEQEQWRRAHRFMRWNRNPIVSAILYAIYRMFIVRD